MTKTDLIKLMEPYPDDAEVVVVEHEMEECVRKSIRVDYLWYEYSPGCGPETNVLDEEEAKEAGIFDEPRVIVIG